MYSAKELAETQRLIELGRKRDATLAKMRARRHSDETKQKIADGVRRYWAEKRAAGGWEPVVAWRRVDGESA